MCQFNYNKGRIWARVDRKRCVKIKTVQNAKEVMLKQYERRCYLANCFIKHKQHLEREYSTQLSKRNMEHLVGGPSGERLPEGTHTKERGGHLVTVQKKVTSGHLFT